MDQFFPFCARLSAIDGELCKPFKSLLINASHVNFGLPLPRRISIVSIESSFLVGAFVGRLCR
ncbi:hypothetical protein Syun_007114 [Stephania yunnanensis]|uniref:Uncharacterized protein n=1 Tax=Stephania yunnanensis TaxID=152371 RepID=A0AAP0KZD8_9MAGN